MAAGAFLKDEIRIVDALDLTGAAPDSFIPSAQH